jgi:DNA (cytosine-5)-methyltransferase 1
MPAVAYAIQERAVSENLENGPQGKGFQEGVAYTLEARNKVQATDFALRGREGGAMPEVEGDQVGALRAASGGSSRSYVAASAVRRLTPEECEKLQGFLPGYTAIPWRKKPADQCPDGPRYKALGNSMAVPCMRWLGERIQQVENLISAQEAA